MDKNKTRAFLRLLAALAAAEDYIQENCGDSGEFREFLQGEMKAAEGVLPPTNYGGPDFGKLAGITSGVEG